MFLYIQHPGEVNGIRIEGGFEDRMISRQTSQGEEFMQTAVSKLAQTSASQKLNDPQKPAIIAIRRVNNQALTRS